MAEAGKFLLEDADGEVPTTRAQKSGYAARAIAQDDAIGQTDPKKAVKGWLDDEHSKKTILGDYDHIGVGIATDAKGVPYWTVLLAKPKG